MTHNVTVTTRTTTTTGTSAVWVNLGYLKSWPGLLKLFQMVLGGVVVGLIGYYYKGYYYQYTSDTFFLLISVTFLIGTFLNYLSCLLSMPTATILSETIYEIVYHGLASILYLAASISLTISTNDRAYNPYSNINDCYLAAAIIGYFITVLYAVSALYPKKIYIGRIIKR